MLFILTPLVRLFCLYFVRKHCFQARSRYRGLMPGVGVCGGDAPWSLSNSIFGGGNDPVRGKAYMYCVCIVVGRARGNARGIE